MRFRRVVLLAALITTAATSFAGAPPAAGRAAPAPVLTAAIKASINPVTADYLASVLERAVEDNAALVVVQLDTPGGLDQAMRDMVQAIIASPVPVAVYVAPSGARAASAGVLITLAADIAAMAPGTNIGAAHPVGIGGGGMDNTMARKVENDAAAYARSLAEKKGRNAAWAESAVRESTSLTEKEALAKGVIDLVAPSLADLLAAVDGRVVEKGDRKVTIRTKGAPTVAVPMGLRHRILSAVADPNIAYILLMIGIYGIFFELWNPGAVFPGVVGGIALLLGFYSLQTLSASYTGFLLIFLAFILFVLEIKVVSHGMLAIGGIVALFLGSLMLFRGSPDPAMRISWSVLLTMVAVSAAFFIAIISLAVRSQLRRPVTGDEALAGEAAAAVADFMGHGKVYAMGELWDAACDVPVRKGERLTVVRREGMTLVVKPADGKDRAGS